MSTSRKTSLNASGGAGSVSGATEKDKVGGGVGTGNSSSKAYSSHLAVQTDATKYRGKYKELKKKVRQIEMENDKLHFKTLRIKRNIQRMRLERAILYERLEAEIGDNVVLREVENTHGNHHNRGPASQPSTSTPTTRRVIDYSPSPEDAKTAAPDLSTSGNGEARQGMKVTLKRNSHANGKESVW